MSKYKLLKYLQLADIAEQSMLLDAIANSPLSLPDRPTQNSKGDA